MSDCPFCLPETDPRIVLADEQSYVIWTGETPIGSAMVIPRAHRRTAFDLSEPEWLSTRRLLAEARRLISEAYAPDGWNVGWNVEDTGGQSVFHAHCHLIPRYSNEPFAGRGIRSWLKSPQNRAAARGVPRGSAE